MKIHVVTLFSEMFTALNCSIPKRAMEQNKLVLNLINPRDFAQDKHKMVDDRPYGGGPGMVMKVDVLSAAIDSVIVPGDLNIPMIFLSPQGKTIKQRDFENWAGCSELLLIAGRYEGVDERLLQTNTIQEYSLGDYVLSGGELGAMVIIDGIVRLLPGVVGDAESVQQESFTSGLLDYPHYTRPEKFKDLKVPDVLLSGDHEAIKNWRLKQSLGKTYLRRPDLLDDYQLSAVEKKLLQDFIKEQ